MKRFCTASPNFGRETQDCCKAHDEAYAKGSGIPRGEADKALYQCVKANGRPWRAAAMYGVVRAFGWIFYRG